MADGIVGLLLASGRGTRFDPSGQRDKLAARLESGVSVIVASAQPLIAVLDTVAVVVPVDSQLPVLLSALPVQIVINQRAHEGMGTSIAAGIAAFPDARGWIIALADMPFIRSETIAALRDALLTSENCGIVAPAFHGQRGHPVAFAARYGKDLLALKGDQGARSLLAQYPFQLLATEDAGILHDIDTVSDLASPDLRP